MLHPMRCKITAALAGWLALASCGSSSPGLTAGRSDAVDTVGTVDTTVEVSLPDTGGTTPPPSTYVPNPNNAIIDLGDGKTPQPYDDFLQASVADVQDYWRETYPAVYGAPYQELSGGIWASYPGRQGIPEGCSGDPREEYIAQGNAFYCGNGDYMAYDDHFLIPTITEMLESVSAVGVVFAHEFGHAIQARVGVLPPEPVVYREQQADCFAGAWTARVARGESPILSFDDDDIKAGLLAMVFVKDSALGVDVFEGAAHGTAFDRVGAFQHGFLGGAAACKDMEVNPLPLLNLQFNSQEEFDTGGNLSYDQIGQEVIADLTRFWTETFQANGRTFEVPSVFTYPHDGPYPSCETIDVSEYPFGVLYCPSTNEILYDEDYAATLYNRFGDFAVGYVISNAWSDDVQTQLGSDLTGEQRILTNDCLTGVWTKDLIPPPAGELGEQLYISPGDLDEAVSTALIIGDPQLDSDQMGSAFEKIDNFRAGVLNGLPECNARITG